MKTKISKVLTVLVTVLSLAFMGAAGISSITRTDWKAKANEYPRTKTQEMQNEITALTKERDDYVALVPQVTAAIEVDKTAMVAKAKVLLEYATSVEAQDKKSREQNAATAITAQERLDVDKVRREEITRLQAQYEELISQRISAQAEVSRLTDLVNQARGVLGRAVSRNSSIKKSLGEPVDRPYDPAVDEQNLPPARPKAGTAPLGPPKKVTPMPLEKDDPPAADDPATADDEQMEEKESDATPDEPSTESDEGDTESNETESPTTEPDAVEPDAEEEADETT